MKRLARPERRRSEHPDRVVVDGLRPRRALQKPIYAINRRQHESQHEDHAEKICECC